MRGEKPQLVVARDVLWTDLRAKVEQAERQGRTLSFQV
jgi:hypothetical protein